VRILVSGASGLIGPVLVGALRSDGHEVVKLVRREPTAGDERRWDPASGVLDPAHVAGADAILESRTRTTGLLAAVAAQLDPRPTAFVCAGGAGVYGNRGDEILTEESAPGDGFLAEVMRETEAAAEPARDAGIRVVNFRQGIVLSRDGGALKRMLPFFRFGVGGPVGSGAQWWSWVSLADVVSAYQLALGSEISGPVNVAAPNPVTSRQFAKALGRALGRPAVLPVPAFGVRVLFGQKGEEVLLFGQRALPARLLDAGFEFSALTIDAGLAQALSPETASSAG
jgi:uncharacterized protein